jgi:lipopolysaccharide export system ATP-binding protein
VSGAARLEALAAATTPADVSSLIALRALVSRAGTDGRVERAAWLTAVREEYQRWYDSDESPRVPTTSGQVANFPHRETVRYLDDHVVRHLSADGVLVPLHEPTGEAQAEPGSGEPPAWTAVRLAEWVMDDIRHDPAGALRVLDTRIREILVAGVPPAAAAPSVHMENGWASEEPAFGMEPETPEPRAVPTPGGATLRASGLVKVYRKRKVVNEVDLHVSQGEIVGLLGPNGAGKTTSFYMMVGLIAPDRGTVHLGEQELTGVPMFKRARAGIGYLSQEPSIFRRLTVEENVLAILQMLGISRAEQRQRLEELLDELSIKHLRKSYAYALSGGERRRLEITRALVGRPKFMLLDEPFAGVDPIAVHDIQQIVSDLRRRGIGVLISDHNVEQTLDIVDRAYIMYDGRVRVSGTVSELVWNDEVAEIYLGPTLTARMRERYSIPEQEEAV